MSKSVITKEFLLNTLARVRKDVLWMLEERKFKNGMEFDYLDSVIDATGEKDAGYLLAALEEARKDILWMLNERKFLNGFVFDYIDKAMDTAKAEGIVSRNAVEAYKYTFTLEYNGITFVLENHYDQYVISQKLSKKVNEILCEVDSTHVLHTPLAERAEVATAIIKKYAHVVLDLRISEEAFNADLKGKKMSFYGINITPKKFTRKGHTGAFAVMVDNHDNGQEEEYSVSAVLAAAEDSLGYVPK